MPHKSLCKLSSKQHMIIFSSFCSRLTSTLCAELGSLAGKFCERLNVVANDEATENASESVNPIITNIYLEVRLYHTVFIPISAQGTECYLTWALISSTLKTLEICLHVSFSVLTAHNWQKWKSRFLSRHYHKIYRLKAVGPSISNYT